MAIRSRPATKQYLDNWDIIFGKKKKKTKVEKEKEEEKVSNEESKVTTNPNTER